MKYSVTFSVNIDRIIALIEPTKDCTTCYYRFLCATENYGTCYLNNARIRFVLTADAKRFTKDFYTFNEDIKKYNKFNHDIEKLYYEIFPVMEKLVDYINDIKRRAGGILSFTY